MLKISYDDEYTAARTPLLGDFPQTPEDEPLSKSQRPKLYVLGLVFTMVFVADLGSSMSKAPLIRGTCLSSPNCASKMSLVVQDIFSIHPLKSPCLTVQP